MIQNTSKHHQHFLCTFLFLIILSACNDGKNVSYENRQHGVVFIAGEESSYLDSGAALYKADFAGKELEQISKLGITDRLEDFKISADSRYVAYKTYSGPDIYSSVYVTDLFVSSENLLTDRFEYPRTVKFDYVSEYEWSPTGSQLLLNQSVDSHGANPRLFLLNPESAQLRQLTFSDRVGGVQWSPTGNHIAFTRVLNGDYSTTRHSTVNVNDLTIADITMPLLPGEQIYSDGYQWSPIGEHITYLLSVGSGEDQLHAARVDGTEHTVLSYDFFGTPSTIKWAPDGKTIMFMADTGIGADSILQLFAIKPDATDFAQISDLLSPEEFTPIAEWINDRNIFYSKWTPDISLGFTENRYLSDSLGIAREDITSPESNGIYAGILLAAPDNLSFLLFFDDFEGDTTIEIREGSGAYISSVEPNENSYISQSMLPQWEPKWSPNSQYFQYMTTSLDYEVRSIVIGDLTGQKVLSIPEDLPNFSASSIYQGFQWSKDSSRGVFLLDITPSYPSGSEIHTINIGSTISKKLSGNLSVSNRAGDVKVY